VSKVEQAGFRLVYSESGRKIGHLCIGEAFREFHEGLQYDGTRGCEFTIYHSEGSAR